jgi:hypothetical protein
MEFCFRISAEHLPTSRLELLRITIKIIILPQQPLTLPHPKIRYEFYEETAMDNPRKHQRYA